MTDYEQCELAEFVKAIMQEAWACTLDGATAQEIAVEHGICYEATATDADCAEGRWQGTPGETFYRLAAWVEEAGF